MSLTRRTRGLRLATAAFAALAIAATYAIAGEGRPAPLIPEPESIAFHQSGDAGYGWVRCAVLEQCSIRIASSLNEGRSWQIVATLPTTPSPLDPELRAPSSGILDDDPHFLVTADGRRWYRGDRGGLQEEVQPPVGGIRRACESTACDPQLFFGIIPAPPLPVRVGQDALVSSGFSQGPLLIVPAEPGQPRAFWELVEARRYDSDTHDRSWRQLDDPCPRQPRLFLQAPWLVCAGPAQWREATGKRGDRWIEDPVRVFVLNADVGWKLIASSAGARSSGNGPTDVGLVIDVTVGGDYEILISRRDPVSIQRSFDLRSRWELTLQDDPCGPFVFSQLPGDWRTWAAGEHAIYFTPNSGERWDLLAHSRPCGSAGRGG